MTRLCTPSDAMTEEDEAPECAEGLPHLPLLASQFFAHAHLWFACLPDHLLLERARPLPCRSALLFKRFGQNPGGCPFRRLHLPRDLSGYACGRRDEIPDDHDRRFRVGVGWL